MKLAEAQALANEFVGAFESARSNVDKAYQARPAWAGERTIDHQIQRTQSVMD